MEILFAGGCQTTQFNVPWKFIMVLASTNLNMQPLHYVVVESYIQPAKQKIPNCPFPTAKSILATSQSNNLCCGYIGYIKHVVEFAPSDDTLRPLFASPLLALPCPHVNLKKTSAKLATSWTQSTVNIRSSMVVYMNAWHCVCTFSMDIVVSV